MKDLHRLRGEHSGFRTAFCFVLLLGLAHSQVFASRETEILSSKKVMPSGDTRVLPEVTVIASRLPSFQIPFGDMPANTSYIPANVTRKSRGAIQAVHPQVIQDTLRDTEGAVFYDAVGNGVDTTFSLRGFSQSSAVVVLVDGVRVNELDGNSVVYPLLRVDDLESLQIDRGSASHIYGDNAFAGVLHLTTGRPSPKRLSLFGGLEISSFRGLRFNQGFSGTLDDKITPLGGKWTYYFNGGRDLGDGFRDNGEFRITSFDIKTGYELPDDQGRLEVGVKHLSDAISNPGELTFDQFQRDPDRTNKPLDGRKFKNTIVQVGGDKKFWDSRLTASALADWRFNRLQAFTTTATFTDFVTGSNPDTDFVSTHALSIDQVYQLAYVDDWRDWLKNESLFGMEFRDGSHDAVEKDAFGGHINLAAATETERHSDTYNTGLFWRQAFELWQRLIVHVGARHDFHWLSSDNKLDNSQDLSNRWRNTSISTGLTLKVARFMETFFNYSQGYRVPTIDEIAPFSGTLSAGLRPEQSDSYEVGTRLHYKDLAAFKTSFFLIDLEDAILFDSTTVSASAPFGQNINTGQSRHTGVENRIDLHPADEVNLFGSYTWTQAWNRTTNPSGSLPDDRALGQIPEHRMTWGLTVVPFKRWNPLEGFRKPSDQETESERETLASGLRFGMNGVFTGRQHPTAYESASQSTLNATGGAGHFIKNYTLWNFMVSYVWRETEIYFKIDNLFDARYYSRAVSATSFGTAIYPSGTYTFVNPGAPREYYGGIRWRI